MNNRKITMRFKRVTEKECASNTDLLVMSLIVLLRSLLTLLDLTLQVAFDSMPKPFCKVSSPGYNELSIYRFMYTEKLKKNMQ